MKRLSEIFAWTTLLFAAGAVLFFSKTAALPYKVAYPVLLLGLSTLLLRRRELYPIGVAFLLSAAGDVMGAKHLFIAQMAFFALAHVAYIWWFLPRARRAPRVLSLAVVVPLLLFLFIGIVPNAPFPAEFIGVAVYGLVIAGMLYSVLQYEGIYSVGFRLFRPGPMSSWSPITWRSTCSSALHSNPWAATPHPGFEFITPVLPAAAGSSRKASRCRRMSRRSARPSPGVRAEA